MYVIVLSGVRMQITTIIINHIVYILQCNYGLLVANMCIELDYSSEFCLMDCMQLGDLVKWIDIDVIALLIGINTSETVFFRIVV